MIKRSIVVAAATLLALVSIPAHGQHQASVGVDAGWANFDKDVTGANAWMLGFRASCFLQQWLELEGQITGGRATEDVGTVNLDTTLLTALVNGVFSTTTRRIDPYVLIGVGGA